METRKLIDANTRVSALGLGCMGMSDFYGPADRDESLKTMGEALRCGVTLLDTGDFYGMGENELLIRELARAKGASLAQLAIAWVLSRGDDMIPLIGARQPGRLRESLGALALALTDQDIARIDQAVPPNAAAGERYDQGQMAMLDSEQ